MYFAQYLHFPHLLAVPLCNIENFTTIVLFTHFLPFLLIRIELPSSEVVRERVREIDEKEVTCYLFTVGELCQLSPAHSTSHLARMVHSLLLATREGGGR